MNRTLVAYLNLGHVIDHLMLLIYPTVVLAMSDEFGRSYADLLSLALGMFITYGLFSLPAGWIADHWSRRGMMVVFFAGIGVSSILTACAQTPFQIAAALSLLGVFASIYHPVGIAMLVSDPENLGKRLGWNGVFGNLGIAFAALLSGALADWLGWRAAFVVPGVLSIAAGIGFALQVREATLGGKRMARAAEPVPRAVLIRVVLVVLVTIICSGIIFNATTVSMPKLLEERVGALASSTTGIGFIASIVFTFAALAQLGVGHLIDRFSLKSVLVPIVAMQVPLLFLAGASDNLAMVFVAIGMMFFIFGQIPINDAMIARYTEERLRSRVYAVRYVISITASAASVPLVAGLHRATGGFEQVFTVLSVLALLTFAAALFLPRRTPIQTSQPILRSAT